MDEENLAGGLSPDQWASLQSKGYLSPDFTPPGRIPPNLSAAPVAPMAPITPVVTPAPIVEAPVIPMAQPPMAQPPMAQLPMAQPPIEQPEAKPVLAGDVNKSQGQRPSEAQRLGMQSYMQGFEQQTGALEAQKAVIAQTVKEQAAIEQKRGALLNDLVQKEADRAKAFQASEDSQAQYLQRKQDDVDTALNDVRSTKIDPNKYWNDKSTGEKIMTAIALVLGGIGGGMTGRGGNAALDVMNNAISRDVEAQKATIESKKELAGMAQGSYSRALQYTNDKRSAAQLAQTMGLQAARMQMEAMAGTSNNLEVKARAAEAVAKIDQQIAQNKMGLAQTFMSSPAFNQHQGDLGVIMSQVPQKLQEKAIAEYDKATGDVENYKNALRVFDTASKVKAEGIIANPIQYNQRMDAAFAQMLPNIKQIFGNLSESDKEEAKSFLPKYMDDNKTQNMKREGLANFLKAKFQQSIVLDRFGINPVSKIQGSSISPEELPTARPNK